MKKICFILLLFPFLLIAQINESDSTKTDSLKVKAGISLTGFFQSGNVETIIFRAKTDFSFVPWKNWVYKNKNSYVYQEFGKEKADEDILSLNFLYINPERKVYPLFLGFVSTNFRREIDLRYLVGTGISVNAWTKDKNWIKLSLTTEYEHTEFQRATFNRSDFNGDKTINTFRGTFWLNGKYYLFKDKLIFTHESYIQPSLDEVQNYRWQADLGLELPVWKFLNFKVNYLHTYESVVIQGQSEDDRFLTFGITLKNY